MKSHEIIKKLNELFTEKEEVGETEIECLIDYRTENGLPPFTPEELAEAEKTCKENRQRGEELINAMEDLCYKYHDLTGNWPVKNEFGYRERWLG